MLRHTQRKEALIPTLLPDRPWKRTVVDLCDHIHHTYLVRLLLQIPCSMFSISSSQVILKLNAVFARFGCPDEVVSDNGP